MLLPLQNISYNTRLRSWLRHFPPWFATYSLYTNYSSLMRCSSLVTITNVICMHSLAICNFETVILQYIYNQSSFTRVASHDILQAELGSHSSPPLWHTIKGKFSPREHLWEKSTTVAATHIPSNHHLRTPPSKERESYGYGLSLFRWNPIRRATPPTSFCATRTTTVHRASKESSYGSLFLVFDVNVLLASPLYFTYLLLIYCSVYYSLQLGVVVIDNYHTMKMY